MSRTKPTPNLTIIDGDVELTVCIGRDVELTLKRSDGFAVTVVRDNILAARRAAFTALLQHVVAHVAHAHERPWQEGNGT